ncbi:RNA polymerase sigma factor [Brucellaceae bacterium C25G]
MSDLVLSDGDDPNASFTKIIECFYSELKNYARHKVGDETIAEELVQEACLRLVNSGSEIPLNPRAYLYRILGNLVTDHYRHKARVTSNFVFSETADSADERPDAEREIIARQRLAILVQAVSELPPRCRECFILRRFDELSHAEIAERMKITRSAVEKHLAVATVYCARRLKAHE